MSERRVWTEEKLNEAAKLWDEGHTASRIAAQLGVTIGSFLGTSSLQRERFPIRMKPKPAIQITPAPIVEAPAPVEPVQVAIRRTYIAGQWVEHVKRTTTTGAVVTMPKVSFIDGMREEN